MAVAIALAAVSCGKGSSIDAALSQIEKAMDKVEKNKTSMTTADWQALNDELEQPVKILNEALESDNVGALKKFKISAMVLRYAAVAGEAALHTASDSLKVVLGETNLGDSINVAAGQIQEALESDEMKQAVKEIMNAVDELKNKKITE